MEPIPITAAKQIAQKYGYDQIVIVARAVGEGEHVTTYGKDKTHCEVAARMGHFLKYKIMGWTLKGTSPEETSPSARAEAAEAEADAREAVLMDATKMVANSLGIHGYVEPSCFHNVLRALDALPTTSKLAAEVIEAAHKWVHGNIGSAELAKTILALEDARQGEG